MNRLFAYFAVVALFSGCALTSARKEPEVAFTAGRGIEQLPAADWMEIKAEIEKYTEFRPYVVGRSSSNFVTVQMIARSDATKGLLVSFEKRDGRWTETEARSGAIAY